MGALEMNLKKRVLLACLIAPLAGALVEIVLAALETAYYFHHASVFFIVIAQSAIKIILQNLRIMYPVTFVIAYIYRLIAKHHGDSLYLAVLVSSATGLVIGFFADFSSWNFWLFGFTPCIVNGIAFWLMLPGGNGVKNS